MLPRILKPFLLSVAATAVLFTASASKAQTKGGTLVYSTVAGPASLDPYMAGSLVELEIIHEIFETLVAMDENYNARPMLASKVEVSNEARTFTFTLRKGVKFSNGQEMNSADVQASFERFAKVSTKPIWYVSWHAHLSKLRDFLWVDAPGGSGWARAGLLLIPLLPPRRLPPGAGCAPLSQPPGAVGELPRRRARQVA